MGELIHFSEWHDGVRRPTRLPAVIRTPGLQSLAATVIDLSPVGASIETKAVPLPSFFLLEIDSAERVERICRVVWRDERHIAVRFVNARTMGRSRRRPATGPDAVTLYQSTAAQ